jgi:O-acetyl-ADP-ribose deacetylase (regulator of RNase III)
MEKTYPLANNKRIRLVEGDITRVAVEAMVNAANPQLLGGGGVDGAIHRAGGPTLMRELDAVRAQVAPLHAGGVVATTAGHLPARYVFHTAGPVYRDGRRGEADALAACYRQSLDLAEQYDLASVSFPAISTGVYGYPPEEAASVAIRTVAGHLAHHCRSVELVVFVQFGPAAFELYRRLLDAAIPMGAAAAGAP